MPRFRVRIRRTLINETTIEVEATNGRTALVAAREAGCEVDEGDWTDRLIDCRVSTVLGAPAERII